MKKSLPSNLNPNQVELVKTEITSYIKKKKNYVTVQLFQKHYFRYRASYQVWLVPIPSDQLTNKVEMLQLKHQNNRKYCNENG